MKIYCTDTIIELIMTYSEIIKNNFYSFGSRLYIVFLRFSCHTPLLVAIEKKIEVLNIFSGGTCRHVEKRKK